MATVVTATKDRAGWRTWIFHLLGVDGVADTSIGSWIDVADIDRMSIHVDGITTGTVQIYGSNTLAKPTDATNHYKLGGDITANTIKEIAVPVKWIKVVVSAWTTGTFKVHLLGQEKRGE